MRICEVNNIEFKINKVMRQTKVIDQESFDEAIKENKAIVQTMVFPSEVEPGEMPKPRRPVVRRYEGGKWVTRETDGTKISDSKNKPTLFGILNSGMFVVVDDTQKQIQKAASFLD